jgi:hypothetical protein
MTVHFRNIQYLPAEIRIFNFPERGTAMKFSDFPTEHVVLNVYDALDELYHDYPLHVLPYFFKRLRKALKYLNINTDSIKGLNSNNQESYIGAVYDLMNQVIDRYEDIIDSVQYNTEIGMRYYTADLLGFVTVFRDIKHVHIDFS